MKVLDFYPVWWTGGGIEPPSWATRDRPRLRPGGGSAVGRAAWSRRPPLTRERKNQHLPPSRAGRVTFSRTLTRWSTAGRAGRQGFGGLAWPADGGTDGLGRSLSVDSSGQGIRPTPPRKRRYGPLSASGFRRRPRKWGFRPDPARSGQKGASSLPSRATCWRSSRSWRRSVSQRQSLPTASRGERTRGRTSSIGPPGPLLPAVHRARP